MTEFMPALMAGLSALSAAICYCGGKPVTGTYYLASSVLLACVILQARGVR